jgi:hypothetical protein
MAAKPAMSAEREGEEGRRSKGEGEWKVRVESESGK